MSRTPLLDKLSGPADLRGLSDLQLTKLAKELRTDVIEAVS